MPTPTSPPTTQPPIPEFSVGDSVVCIYDGAENYGRLGSIREVYTPTGGRNRYRYSVLWTGRTEPLLYWESSLAFAPRAITRTPSQVSVMRKGGRRVRVKKWKIEPTPRRAAAREAVRTTHP